MCMLLKLDYAKFGVSNLYFSKVIKENLWGGGSPPPPPQKKGLIVISFVRLFWECISYEYIPIYFLWGFFFFALSLFNLQVFICDNCL